MFVPKASVPTTTSTDIHLPTVSKTKRRHFRSSPTPSITSSTSVTATPPDNVSALKAKYFDYAMWLRAASRKNREPIFTHELLKHSLCQMGIDAAQAEQLVSTCSWYVYQFHKELQGDTSPTNSLISKEPTTKKPQSMTKKRTRKTRVNKVKKHNTYRDVSDESSLDRSLNNHKEDLSYPSPPPPTRHKYSVLPSINPRDQTISPRTRHVDFDDEKPSIQTFKPEKSSHWRSGMKKIRVLPKLRRSDNDSSIITNTDINNDNLALDSDISNSQRSFQKFQPTQTRSILRKQISSTSSIASLDIGHRANRSRLLTPVSTIIDEVPLGTKSQKLFGGSECFAQIMNELEEQVRIS